MHYFNPSVLPQHMVLYSQKPHIDFFHLVNETRRFFLKPSVCQIMLSILLSALCKLWIWIAEQWIKVNDRIKLLLQVGFLKRWATCCNPEPKAQIHVIIILYGSLQRVILLRGSVFTNDSMSSCFNQPWNWFIYCNYFVCFFAYMQNTKLVKA